MLHDRGRSRLLLEAVQRDDIQRWTIRSKYRLLMNRDNGIRALAEKLLVPKAGERENVVKQYAGAATMNGDPQRGRQVFEKVCAKCHRLNGFGAKVGPDLGEVRNRPPQTLLEDILIPSKMIASGYESYVVEMVRGGTIDGVIGPQTPTTITLRQEEGKEQLIRRSDIKSFYMANLSGMPADLEKQISVEQMADLLKYLKAAQ